MVDTSVKEISRRVARATATLQLSQKVFQLLLKQGSPKGNVFETAKLAGIMAAKSTPQMIPLCHPLEINKVTVNFVVNKKKSQIIAQSEVACLGRTGVEMEALAAASIAVLTIYDMMKWAGQDMTMTDVMLLHKSGGKSGTYNRR
ncbi:MAG: molybdenum cofactor biosynthesis protein C [Omnitrophica WOR_2 bacterium RIFCSPHIGHO2_01_FULL_48_9]|nr:MAG: molybdenum cofactor biosynthesis protein C [Omnitrophica WOR_2 bacterium RIFCSPHIGHO2_02_FULL_48_11]OGX31222.1 MAG: molybdenum cofactor biosynthesis protein C [Omnitrophica WOR_2 bacterium RIFCSPHIGHO2_01_FULL_48_9]